MTTKNPRISISLKQSTHATLERMSVLTRNSKSAIVGELLEEAEPVFERMVRIMEAAGKAKSDAQGSVVKGLEDAQRVLEVQLGLLESDFATRSKDLVDGLETVARRAGRVPAGRAAAAGTRLAAPISNRGVRLPPKGKEVHKSKRIRKWAKKG